MGISAIKDNRTRGKVGDFLKDCLKDGSTLSFVSAYFTIYAYEKLKDQLQKIDHLNFLFGGKEMGSTLDTGHFFFQLPHYLVMSHVKGCPLSLLFGSL